jgi:hypothetical protein
VKQREKEKKKKKIIKNRGEFENSNEINAPASLIGPMEKSPARLATTENVLSFTTNLAASTNVWPWTCTSPVTSSTAPAVALAREKLMPRRVKRATSVKKRKTSLGSGMARMRKRSGMLEKDPATKKEPRDENTRETSRLDPGVDVVKETDRPRDVSPGRTRSM